MEEINVYVDGACINNGSAEAKAGYGVYFGEDDPRNEYNTVKGKQTNNTGELTAFIRALEILEDEKHEDYEKCYLLLNKKEYCKKLLTNLV